MKIRRFFAVACLLLLLVACTQEETPDLVETIVPTATPEPSPTPATAVSGTVIVQPDISKGEINPYVYGTNYGPWITVPMGVMEDYLNSGLTFIRFPGGNWGDTNTIRDYQLDQFMDLAGMIDADVSVSTNLLEGTPEQAAELVRYANVENDYNIQYWSIGNEPNLFPESRGADEYLDTDFYNARWREFAEAMKAVDPNIKLIGPDTNQFRADETTNPKDAQGRDWLRQFLKANGDMVDIVAVHRYPFPENPSDGPPPFEELRDNSEEWDELVPTLRNAVFEETGEDLPLAIMEFNSNWSSAAGSDTSPDSFYNAIWLADALGRMIDNDIDMVAQFALQHNTNGWGLLDRSVVRPSYYVYQLYKRFGNEQVHANSAVPYVSVFAAKQNDGTLTVMLINRDKPDVTIPLTIDNFTPSSNELWRFDQEHNAENLGAIDWENGGEISLPGQSISLLVLEGNNE